MTSYPQPKSIPKPRPVKPACKTSSATPPLVSVPPPKADAALTAVPDKVKKRKSEELEVDVDGDAESSLSESESVSDGPVAPTKHGRKSQKKTVATATKKRKGRK